MFADIGHLHQLPHCSALLAEEAKYVFFAAMGLQLFSSSGSTVTQAARLGLVAEGRDLRESESGALVARA